MRFEYDENLGLWDFKDQQYLDFEECAEKLNKLETENKRLKEMMRDVVEQIENHKITGDEECPFCMGELISHDDIKEFNKINTGDRV